jgi:hypothetical protein
MSALSFIPSLPVASQDAPTTPGKTASKEAEPAREKEPDTPALQLRLANKTTVKTEARTNFSFTYTFIDTETQRVIGQWPAPSMMGRYGK